DELPAPEGEGCQFGREQRHMTGALHAVVRRCEQRTAAEGENHGVRVQGPQTAIGKPFGEVQFGPDQLGGNDDADQHADHAPDHRHVGELAHDLVVVSRLRLLLHACPHSQGNAVPRPGRGGYSPLFLVWYTTGNPDWNDPRLISEGYRRRKWLP